VAYETARCHSGQSLLTGHRLNVFDYIVIDGDVAGARSVVA
jgi:hypothetical protein